MKPLIRIAMALGALYGAAALDVARANAGQEEIRYELIETRNGHDYIIDYDLSDEDCFTVVKDNQRCEAE